MKIFISIICVFVFFKTQAQDSRQDIAALFVLLQNQQISVKQADDAYYKIANLIKNKISKKSSDVDMKDLLKLSVMYFKHFHSDDAYEFVFDLYKFNRTEFQKAFQKLNPKEKKQINLFLKYSSEAEKKGIG